MITPFVRALGFHGQSTGTSVTLTTTAGATLGQTVIAVVRCRKTETVTSVTDSVSNTYVKDCTTTVGTQRVANFRTVVTHAFTTGATIVGHFNATAGVGLITANVYKTLATSPFVTPAKFTGGTSQTGHAVTETVATQFLVIGAVAVGFAASTVTVATGPTIRSSGVSPQALAVADEVVGPGSVKFTWAWTGLSTARAYTTITARYKLLTQSVTAHPGTGVVTATAPAPGVKDTPNLGPAVVSAIANAPGVTLSIGSGPAAVSALAIGPGVGIAVPAGLAVVSVIANGPTKTVTVGAGPAAVAAVATNASAAVRTTATGHPGSAAVTATAPAPGKALTLSVGGATVAVTATGASVVMNSTVHAGVASVSAVAHNVLRHHTLIAGHVELHLAPSSAALALAAATVDQRLAAAGVSINLQVQE